MYHSDIFDIKLWDQYVNRGYQKRVMMRGSWVTIPLADHLGSYASILDKRIDERASKTLVEAISNRYRYAKFYKERSQPILDMISDIQTNRLWQFNLELIIGIRDILGIATPISMSMPTIGRGSVGLVSVLKRYNPTHYMSGTGARVYMEDSMHLFADAGIEVIWSNHKAISGDSILTTIFDHADPLSIVLMENEEEH